MSFANGDTYEGLWQDDLMHVRLRLFARLCSFGCITPPAVIPILQGEATQSASGLTNCCYTWASNVPGVAHASYTGSWVRLPFEALPSP
jgi:hypothetical protein